VPGYEILDLLGKGGMGIVYKARQQTLGRLVALKMILHAEHAADRERQRFQAEAEAVARLQHPNIVAVFEVGQHGGCPFFSLEYCPGGTLADKLDGTPWPVDKAADLVQTLAGAVHAAHRAGIVHRDLKPGNVLLTEDGQPKITDFGLAKRIGEQSHTQTGAILGTPSYMAPEQAGGNKHVGPAADVYALGAILYELLTGRPPFKAATSLDTILQVASYEPVPVRHLQPKVPRDLETLCHKCLQKDSKKRYESAQALAEDLGRFLAGKPILARAIGLVERSVKWARRRPALAGLVSVSVAAGVALLALGLWFTDRVSRERDDAIRARADAEKARDVADDMARRATEAYQEAGKEKVQAIAQRERTNWLAYAGQLALAQREWQDNNVWHARELLDACRWDFRDFEHAYLRRLVEGSRLTLTGHSRWLNAVAYSPDGTRLASASQDETVKLWDAATGRLLRTLRGHKGEVRAVCFGPDGRLASAGQDGDILLWDRAGDQPSSRLSARGVAIEALAFQPTGGRLASGAVDGSVRIWDVATGKKLHFLEGHTEAVRAVSFSPDGTRLASAGEDGLVVLWDAAAGKALRALPRQRDRVNGVCFSPDGTRLLTSSVDGSVKLWDPRTGKMLVIFGHDTEAVLNVCYSPDGMRLAAGCADRTVLVWDSAGGRSPVILRGHTGPVTCVRFSPDGTHLASAGADATVRIWEVPGLSPTALEGSTDAVRAMSFLGDGTHLASVAADGTMKVWDVLTGENTRTLGGPGGVIPALCLSADGTRLALATADGTVKIRDALSGQVLHILPAQGRKVFTVCFDPSGSHLATGADDGKVRLWDVSTGNLLHTLAGHQQAIHAACFSRDGRLLAAAAQDGTIKIWDVASGENTRTLVGHVGRVEALCFDSTGQWLASASADRTVKVWFLTLGRIMHTLEGHTGEVHAVCFSPDGQRLASAGTDGLVKLWHRVWGQELLTLKGHAGGVFALSFSPDGKVLASGGRDRSIRLWDARGAPDSRRLRGLAAGVLAVSFSADGKRVVSRSAPQQPGGTGDVRSWDTASGQEVVPSPDPVPAPGMRAVSPDGLLEAVVEGGAVEVRRTDLPAPNSAQDERRARYWHRCQAAQAWRGGQWLAAAFHLCYLLPLELGAD
jgi:WD40 repeat protein/tRNA A-37 threonylcarbamoyl transferase component Bud32